MEGSDHKVLQINPGLIGGARSLQAFSVKKKTTHKLNIFSFEGQIVFVQGLNSAVVAWNQSQTMCKQMGMAVCQ